jgi:hypothetical protein
VSWTPDQEMMKKSFKASVEWNFGPFGKLEATEEFTLDAKPVAPKSVPIRRILVK